MSIGLDLGTTEFRSIRLSADELVVRRCQAAYLTLRDTPGHRRLLENTQARHATCSDDLIVFGDDAIECAGMLDLSVNPLLRHGRLPSSDPVARQILALILEAILPPARHDGAVCFMTVPGGYSANGDNQSLDVRYLQQLVALRGYTPQLTSAGLAIALTELSSASFLGLGISLGATCCEIGVIHCGRELARWAIAGNLSELTDEFPLDSTSSAGLNESQQAAWSRMCLPVLTNILTEAREALVKEGSIRLIPQPTSIACAGGITAASGFAGLFEQAWHQAGWPIQTGKIHLSDQPSLAVARGCLIQAIMESDALPDRTAA